MVKYISYTSITQHLAIQVSISHMHPKSVTVNDQQSHTQCISYASAYSASLYVANHITILRFAQHH